MVAEIVGGEDCTVFNAATNNGETWNITGTVNDSDTGIMDLKAEDGTTNLTATFTNDINATFGWRGANVAEIPQVTQDQTSFTTDIQSGTQVRWTDKDGNQFIYIYAGESTLTTASSPIIDLATNSDFFLAATQS